MRLGRPADDITAGSRFVRQFWRENARFRDSLHRGKGVCLGGRFGRRREWRWTGES